MKTCPLIMVFDIFLISFRFREAGKEVARVLQKFTPLLERASIDEAYLDITASVSTTPVLLLQNGNLNINPMKLKHYNELP